LDSATLAEMQAWVTSHPLPADTAAALRSETAGAPAENGARTAPPNASASSSASALEDLDAALQLPAEGWQRWTLMPGLELQLKNDAAPITRTLAARLCRAFASFVS
jgi:hypothetical protein